MRITEAILLAGGEGTRLQPMVPGLPKCLATVNGRPFIDYLLQHLQAQGIHSFIFALGFKAKQVQEHLDQFWPGLDKIYSVETTPLGTGGAIKKAATCSRTAHVLVLNADTYFAFHLQTVLPVHEQKKWVCTMLLKYLPDTTRFGKVELDEQANVVAFKEKQAGMAGLINAGVYIIDLPAWNTYQWPEAFSFEKDFLEKNTANALVGGLEQDHFFIDIGVPADFLAAQSLLPQ